MSTRAATKVNRDIRSWARERGIDLGARGRIPDEVRAGYFEENGAPEPGDGGAGEQPSDDGAAEQLERLEGVARAMDGAPDSAPSGAETAPVDTRRRSLWGLPGGGSGAPRKRESLATLAAFAWGGMAQAASRAGRVPTSRMLTLQAPVAGMLLDDAVRGTLVDKVLQPFARTGKRGEALFALVGPPILVEMIMRHPERQATLIPLLAAALEQYADLAGPKLAAAKRKAEKRAQELGADGIEELIQFLFAPPDAPPGGADSGDRRAA
jgi:hypothetical protein